MELIFIRHFPTKGNCLKQYIGRTDESLDETAVKEILNEIGNTKAFYPQVECVVTSPMIRCKQTTELIYPGIQTFSCELLKETDFGDFEGKTYEELKDNEDYQQWLMSGATGVVPNGESRAQFRARCLAGMDEVMDMLIEKELSKAAIVVHGGTMMSLMSEYAEEKQEFYYWQVKNGKGYQVHVDQKLWKSGKKVFSDIRKL